MAVKATDDCFCPKNSGLVGSSSSHWLSHPLSLRRFLIFFGAQIKILVGILLICCHCYFPSLLQLLESLRASWKVTRVLNRDLNFLCLFATLECVDTVTEKVILKGIGFITQNTAIELCSHFNRFRGLIIFIVNY